MFSQPDADDRVKGKQFERICKWFLAERKRWLEQHSAACHDRLLDCGIYR